MPRTRVLAVLAFVCLASQACSSGQAPAADSSALRAAARTYEGFHDVTNCGGIMGWAWDPKRPDEALKIDLYDRDKKFATVTAGEFRQDLLDAHKGNGKHGFLLATPPEFKDGRTHFIFMKYAGTSVELLNGPREITCRP